MRRPGLAGVVGLMRAASLARCNCSALFGRNKRLRSIWLLGRVPLSLFRGRANQCPSHLGLISTNMRRQESASRTAAVLPPLTGEYPVPLMSTRSGPRVSRYW